MYTAVVFLSSAGALILEIAAGRLIAPYVGMSLYTWTAIIAVVLAGLSVGHWVGGRLADRGDDTSHGNRHMVTALGAAAVLTLLSLPLLRVIADPLLRASGDSVFSVVALTSGLFFLPSLSVGIVSPIATKLAIDANPHRQGKVLGRMFAAGASGSIIGTLAAGYIFISWIGTTGTVTAVAGLYVVLALSLLPTARIGKLLTLGLTLSGAASGTWTMALDAHDTPCDIESDYFCIRIDDYVDQLDRESRLMALDHLVHSINDRIDPTLLYSPYVQLVDEVVRGRFGDAGPASAYFVGGGGFTLPRAWNAAFPTARMIVAEIDPAVTTAAKRHLWLAPSDRLDILTRDARVGLRLLPDNQRFDVIFGDAFHDIAVPAHLVTREFNALVASRLNPGGLYAINIVDRARDPQFLYAMIRTMETAFTIVEVWLSTDTSIDDDRVTFIVFGADEPTPLTRLSSKHGLERSWVRWPVNDLAQRIATSNPPILTDSFAPVERLLTATD